MSDAILPSCHSRQKNALWDIGEKAQPLLPYHQHPYLISSVAYIIGCITFKMTCIYNVSAHLYYFMFVLFLA